MPSPTGIVKKAMGGTSQAAHALAALQDAESCANLVAKCNDVLATIEQKKSWNHRTRRRYETALHSLVARLVPPELLSCLSCWKPDTSARTSPQCKVVTMDNYISTLPRTVRMRKDSDDLRRWFCWWVVRWAYVEHANHAVKRISRPSVQQTKKWLASFGRSCNTCRRQPGKECAPQDVWIAACRTPRLSDIG